MIQFSRPKAYPYVNYDFYNWINVIQDDCKRGDWDRAVIVSGIERGTKSTFTYHGSRMFENNKGVYDWKKHFILSPNFNLVMRILQKAKKQSMVLDEAVKVLYKLKMWDDLQILLNQVFTVNGQNNNLTFINIPRQKDLNKFFRDGRAYYWVQVIERGVASIFVRDEDQMVDDVWHFKDAIKIRNKHAGKMWTFLSAEDKIKIHRKYPNYVCTALYDDIPEPHRAEYKKLKMDEEFNGLKIEERFGESTAKKHRDMLINELLENAIYKPTNKGYTQTMLANVLGMSHSQISRWLKKRKEAISLGIQD